MRPLPPVHSTVQSDFPPKPAPQRIPSREVTSNPTASFPKAARGVAICGWIAVLALGWDPLSPVAGASAPSATDRKAQAALDAASADALKEAVTTPRIRDFLSDHCVECHDADTQKGKFRADNLSELPPGDAAIKWGRILTRLEAGEMPPPKKAQPAPESTLPVLKDLKTALAAEAKIRRVDGRARTRRLNRIEYENTLHDLLGIRTPLKGMLPEDDTEGGFDTSARALSISPVHVHRYMEAAEKALQAAIVRHPPPEPSVQRFFFGNEKEQKGVALSHGSNKPMIHVRDGNLLFFGEPHIEVPVASVQAAEAFRAKPGLYKIRVSVFTQDARAKGLVFALKTTSSRKLLGYFDAPATGGEVVEVGHWFEPGDNFVIAPYLLDRARSQRGLSRYPAKDGTPPAGLALGVEWIELEGPLTQEWPPQGHRRLFGDLALTPFNLLPKGTAPGVFSSLRAMNKPTPVAEDPAGAAKMLLSEFLPRAFRRPVEPGEIEQYLQIVLRGLEQKECLEAALLSAYQSALCSPEFLFLDERPGPLSPHALACRLSYALWRSPPDEHLRSLADSGNLRSGSVLGAEIKRHLESPRSNAFIHDFLDQWLHLRDLDATMPDRDLYPEFYENLSSAKVDGLLRESIAEETRLFFGEILRSGGSLLQLIDSDWTFLNSRLAEFYGLAPVSGVSMRKVSLPPNSVRGGILTQASILKVTANGSRTSPVLRGAWVLESLIGRPPPPPPPNVGTLEPDTRGASTVREQLAKHQNNESCASCHRQIDPPGFALEAFDPIGQWRPAYRTTETGTPVRIKSPDGNLLKYRLGAEVDASGKLPDGGTFAGPWGFKKLTLRHADAVSRCLAAKLVTYATGQTAEPGDLLALDRVVEQVKKNNYSLSALLSLVLQSELFTHK